MANAKVLVSDKLGEAGLEILRGYASLAVDYRPGLSEDALREAIGGCEGLVISSRSRVTASVQLGLDRRSGRALALWNVDDSVPEEAAVALRALKHVRSVHVVQL